MKRNCIRILVCLLFLPIVVGCVTKILLPEWNSRKDAIRVHINAEPKLSLYNAKAQPQYLAVYQLTDLNAFDPMTRDATGIEKLLECKIFDPSVVAVNSKTIHAGEQLTLTLDRAEKAKYVAIVLGIYENLNDAHMVRRYKIQVRREAVNPIGNEYKCTPCILDIEMETGQGRIENSKVVENGCIDECR